VTQPGGSGLPSRRATRYATSDDFPQPPTVAACRAAAVAQLRDLATNLEQLPLDAVT